MEKKKEINETTIPQQVQIPEELQNSLQNNPLLTSKKRAKFVRNSSYLKMASRRKSRDPEATKKKTTDVEKQVLKYGYGDNKKPKLTDLINNYSNVKQVIQSQIGTMKDDLDNQD